jgi:hypothetical protein
MGSIALPLTGIDSHISKLLEEINIVDFLSSGLANFILKS